MTANPRRGWRIDVPAATFTRTEAGRFRLPVLVECDGYRVMELDLVLTGQQIEQLHASMRGLVGAGFPARETASVPQRREGLDL